MRDQFGITSQTSSLRSGIGSCVRQHTSVHIDDNNRGRRSTILTFCFSLILLLYHCTDGTKHLDGMGSNRSLNVERTEMNRNTLPFRMSFSKPKNVEDKRSSVVKRDTAQTEYV